MKVKKVKKAVIVNRTPPSSTDPLGSYTGRPLDPHDLPEQDADDL